MQVMQIGKSGLLNVSVATNEKRQTAKTSRNAINNFIILSPSEQLLIIRLSRCCRDQLQIDA